MSTSLKFENLRFIKTRYVFLWLLLFYFAFTSLYGLLQQFVTFLPGFEDPIVNQILYSCSFISLCFYLIQELRQSEINVEHIFGNLRPSYRWLPLLGWAIMFLLFSVGAALISFRGLSLVAPEFHESFMKSIAEQESRESAVPIINQCWQTVNYVAVAPITEEIIFLGTNLHRLAMKWNLPVAIWISSIIFGLLHPNPIGISAVGVAWALLYIKTRTLVVPIIAHCMNNAIVVLVEFGSAWLQHSNPNEITNNMTGDEWIAGLLLVALSLPFIVVFIYRRFPAKDASLPYFANHSKAI
ncbi:MAG: lysostaphin resistance A-like protein [Pleurocapsa sp.]